MKQAEFDKRMSRLKIMADRVLQTMECEGQAEAKRLAEEVRFARHWQSLFKQVLREIAIMLLQDHLIH